MRRHCCVSLGWLLVLAGSQAPLAAQTLKATPTSLSFTYTTGTSTLPAAQTLSIAPAAGTTVISFSAGVAGASWLAVTPDTAKTNATLKVSANPTSLSVGTYTATIVLTPVGAGTTVLNIPVTLQVKAPPATLSASPTSLAFTYTRGAPPPAALTVQLSGNGSLLPYSVSVGSSTWLKVSPMSGIIFPAFTSALSLTVDPTGLNPGSYRATVTVSSTSAANKSVALDVTLTVTPGLPTLSTMFPTGITAGSPTTTVTLTGTNFYSGSTVAVGATPLSSTILGPTSLQAVIPSSMLSSPGILSITVSNPNPGGGTSVGLDFTVYTPGPRLTGVTNAASFATGAIAPGEMIILFGTGLGPEPLVPFSAPPPGGSIATSLSGVSVSIDALAAPLIYVSSTQIAAMVPFGLVGPMAAITVTNGGQTSPPMFTTVVPTAPGLFTLTSTGLGQAAAFNLNETTGELTLNTETNTVSKGGVVLLFGTGAGVTNPAGSDGGIPLAAADFTIPSLSVKVGGQDATVLYFGPAPGLVHGLFQLNLRLNPNTPAGKAVPIVLTMGGTDSPNGVTLGVK